MRVKAEINLENFRYNLKTISKNLTSDKIMAIIKANAYGHGDEEILKECIEMGINFFGVATKDEALKLKKIAPNSEFLILSPVSFNDIKFLSKKNIHLTISNFSEIEYILKNKIEGKFHIAYDTGMGRIGFSEKNIERAIETLNPIGIFSHFSSADTNFEYTNFQKIKFEEIVSKYDIKYVHLLNSFATENYLDKFGSYSLVRLGILMYGGEKNEKYKPVMSLKARVNFVKKLEEDSNIGYSNTYRAKKGDIIATISAGYADGIPRQLSNKGKVFLNDKEYNIIGNVCMDQFMILADENIKIGDFVEIFGENIYVSNLAKSIDTISYEILCLVSQRVKRIYLRGEKCY